MTIPTRRFRRRARYHVLIALGAVAVGLAASSALGHGDLRSRLSVATAYVALACVASSLLLGPINLLRDQPNPVSSDLRRDIGLWGGIVGLVHFGVGLTVHQRGKMYQYFFPAHGAASTLPVRLDAFGAANYAGLLAGGVLLLLVVLSSDLALRRLGTARWKRLQQLNYVCAAAIVAHGVLYQAIEKRRLLLVLVFLTVTLLTIGLQYLGVRIRKKALLARPNSR